MKYVVKVWEWLVWSSTDPSKISLTLKGAIPFLVLFLGWKGVDQTFVQENVSQIIDLFANTLVLLVQLGTALVALVGLVRKVWLTVVGKTA